MVALEVWVQGSGPVCVARTGVKVRGEANIQGMQSKSRLRRAARDWSIKKGEESFKIERVLSMSKSLTEALGGLTVNSPGNKNGGASSKGKEQGLGGAYLHRWTDFVGASWHRSRLGRASSSQGEDTGVHEEVTFISRPWGAVGCGQVGGSSCPRAGVFCAEANTASGHG